MFLDSSEWLQWEVGVCVQALGLGGWQEGGRREGRRGEGKEGEGVSGLHAQAEMSRAWLDTDLGGGNFNLPGICCYLQ